MRTSTRMTILLAALVSITGLTSTASTASATSARSAVSAAHTAGTVACDTDGTLYFKPGVQVIPLPQDIEVRGANGNCRDSSGLGIREARLSANFDDVWLTCELGGAGTGHGTGTIDWILIDGSRVQSRLDLNFEINVASLITLTGQVVGGPLDGERFSASLNADLIKGALKCTLGGPFGGVKSVGYRGGFTVGG